MAHNRLPIGELLEQLLSSGFEIRLSSKQPHGPLKAMAVRRETTVSASGNDMRELIDNLPPPRLTRATRRPKSENRERQSAVEGRPLSQDDNQERGTR